LNFFFQGKEDFKKKINFFEKKFATTKKKEKKERETFGLLFLAIKFARYFITSSLQPDKHVHSWQK
jgi:hypothetical protein